MTSYFERVAFLWRLLSFFECFQLFIFCWLAIYFEWSFLKMFFLSAFERFHFERERMVCCFWQKKLGWWFGPHCKVRCWIYPAWWKNSSCGHLKSLSIISFSHWLNAYFERLFLHATFFTLVSNVLILTFDALAMTSSFEFPFLKNILRLYYKMKLVHFHRCMFDWQLFVGTKKGLCLPASCST